MGPQSLPVEFNFVTGGDFGLRIRKDRGRGFQPPPQSALSAGRAPRPVFWRS